MIREFFPGGMLPPECSLKQGLESGKIILVDTSGTTEDKITNIWNQAWWDNAERASWQLNSAVREIATGEHHEAILVNPLNVGIISDEVDLTLDERRTARFLYLNEKTDPLAWSPGLMDRMIEEINLFRPAVLEANPSYLARLCRYITAVRKTVFQPGVIIFTYEYPTRLHYRQIRQVFNIPLVSSYGTTETGYVFMQCEEGKLHQNSDYCRVDFQPFKKEYGGPWLGRILVTPLRNPWSYILRFDTGDLVQLEESGRCACGRRSGLVLSAVCGRTLNLTLTGSGRPVTLFELDNALNELEKLVDYKLLQTAPGAYEMHLVCLPADQEKTGQEARKILTGIYGQDARINIIYDMDIAPEISGKYIHSRALFPVELGDFLEK
jgi:phenylacetate-coenzyme A ligase PaaK-like adenylate-forming protein